MRSTDRTHKNPLCDTPWGIHREVQSPQNLSPSPWPGRETASSCPLPKGRPGLCRPDTAIIVASPSGLVFSFIVIDPVTAREAPDRDPGGSICLHRGRADGTPSRRIRTTPRSWLSCLHIYTRLHTFAPYFAP